MTGTPVGGPLRVRFTHDIFMRQRTGGVSRYFAELATHLPEHGVEVVLPTCIHVSDHLTQGLHVPSSIPIARRGSPVRSINRRIERYSQARSTDHLSTVLHPTYYRVDKSAGPSVITVWDLTHYRIPQCFPDAAARHEILRRSLSNTSAVITISETTRHDLLNAFPSLDPEAITTTPLAPTLAVPTEEMVCDTPYILYVGQRNGYKAFDHLLRAFAQASLPAEVGLVAFGGGSFNRDERSLIQALGLTRSVMQVSGGDSLLSAAYRDALALAYPSLYEGFGLPVAEAMAAGLPVVCSSGGALAEVAGNAAVLVPPGEVEGLSDALYRVVDDADLRTQYSELGRQRATAFTWADTASRTLEAYRLATSRWDAREQPVL